MTDIEGSKVETQTVVFADVAGSTALYERVGDTEAERSISQLIEFMIAAINRHNGVVIKTIGDEVMCRFKSASHALLFAVEVQQSLVAVTDSDPNGLQVRIGMQYGSVIMKDGDVFGDTVNVAARMAGLALATQIIATSECVEEGAAASGVDYRLINSLYVKGREKPVGVCEILWRTDDNELTTLSGPTVGHESSRGRNLPLLEISYGDQVCQLSDQQSKGVVGRSGECDIVVPSPAASRVHIELSVKRGKILLADRSTNGTFVKFESGEDFLIHKEELPLTGRGLISLGAPFIPKEESLSSTDQLCEDPDMEKFLVRYWCQY